jgi:hypothetical protein
MSKNKYKKQVWVLPEDDANRQIAQGFTLEASVNERGLHLLPVAGGWAAIRDGFKHEYNNELLKCSLCSMVLLVDFDDKGARRLEEILSGVDPALQARVFVLGARGEPERLRTSLRMTYEQIGKTLAKECSDGTRATWEHELLAHNRGELERMVPHVRPILFG